MKVTAEADHHGQRRAGTEPTGVDTFDPSANLIASDVPQPSRTSARLCARRRGGPRGPAGVYNGSLAISAAVAEPERIR